LARRRNETGEQVYNAIAAASDRSPGNPSRRLGTPGYGVANDRCRGPRFQCDIRSVDGIQATGSQVMKCIQIEIAAANFFDIRRNIIVPNVSWGLGLHECDLLVVRRQSLCAIEVEIKTTKADLKKDARKRHGHKSNKIRQMYFAVPEKLAAFALETLDPEIGVLSVVGLRATQIRPARIRAGARPLSQAEALTLATLGTMRIWSLKRNLLIANAVPDRRKKRK
jgi:hypothetical protein